MTKYANANNDDGEWLPVLHEVKMPDGRTILITPGNRWFYLDENEVITIEPRLFKNIQEYHDRLDELGGVLEWIRKDGTLTHEQYTRMRQHHDELMDDIKEVIMGVSDV